MDLPAEFYLETIERVFLKNQLANKSFTYRGRLVDASSIQRVSLFAVEGEKDDITGCGQTRAVLDLATNLPKSKKKYHCQEGVGHYGLFSGTKYRTEIAPLIKQFIEETRNAPIRSSEPPSGESDQASVSSDVDLRNALG